MIKKFLLYVPVVSLCFTGITYADYYTQTDSTTMEADRNGHFNAQISDNELIKKIGDKIGSGWFTKGYDKVRIQVSNGIVTLTGSVKTWDDKEKVEKVVHNIQGIRRLNSQIAVDEPSTREHIERRFSQDTFATAADDQLNKKIRDNVSRGWLWDSYKEVALKTSNGVITLEGFVDSIGDQQKLMTEIQKINGVKTVKSNLKIRNHNF